MTERFFEQLLGAEFDQLHPVIQRHFFFRPDSGQQLTVKGVMSEVSHSGGIAWIYLPSAFVLGGPVPYRGRNVPVTVDYRVDGQRLIWRRQFDFGARRWVFPSYMTIQGAGLGTEYLRGGIGVEFEISRSGGGLSFRSIGYHWKLGSWRVPLPLGWLLGELSVEEKPESDTTFSMSMLIEHRWFGKLFEYRGCFELPRDGES